MYCAGGGEGGACVCVCIPVHAFVCCKPQNAFVSGSQSKERGLPSSRLLSNSTTVWCKKETSLYDEKTKTKNVLSDLNITATFCFCHQVLWTRFWASQVGRPQQRWTAATLRLSHKTADTLPQIPENKQKHDCDINNYMISLKVIANKWPFSGKSFNGPLLHHDCLCCPQWNMASQPSCHHNCLWEINLRGTGAKMQLGLKTF